MKKTINTIIIFLLTFSPGIEIYAATIQTDTGAGGLMNIPQAQNNQVVPQNNNQNLTPTFVNSQIDNAISSIKDSANSANASSTKQNGTLGNISSNVVGCGAGQLLSSIITSSVTKAIGGTVSNAVDRVINVPVSEQGSVGDALKTQTSARVGTSAGFGGISALAVPSWDSVAYCIVNAMLEYITYSTIAWINTGFEGNPAFIENPEVFFERLADQEAAVFMDSLAYGILGDNICKLFKADIVLGVANQYIGQRGYGGYDRGGYGYNGQNPYGGCTFNENTLERFVSGDFIQAGGWNSWYDLTQNPQNNPFDVYINVTDSLTKTVNNTVNNTKTELSWNNGWLNFKTCDNPKDSKTCKTTTPGTVIQSQLEKTLNLGKDRLLLQDKFDQVVSALVNQLIKTALNKSLETIKN